jgi:NAD(P)-dependent dehydrogenase (short-subunit alcohol dehydrogenase family)
MQFQHYQGWNSMIDLSGNVVLITGGAGGIGRAAAEAFVRVGCRVVLADISAELGEEAVREISQGGGEAVFVKADVSEPEQVANYVRAARERFGRIDVFINNAAWEGVVQSLVEYPEEVFDKVIAINVRGVFLGLKHVLPVMYEQGGGVVINTSSIAGHIGSPGLVAYTASKHAVLGMTKTAALEGAKFNVRVNAVSPGAVDTRMLRSLAQSKQHEEAEAAMEKYALDSPNGRLATPEEIANVMLFLASDLSNHISGQSYRVDGGRIMY